MCPESLPKPIRYIYNDFCSDLPSDAVAALQAAVERLGRAHDFRALAEGRQEKGEQIPAIKDPEA